MEKLPPEELKRLVFFARITIFENPTICPENSFSKGEP
jgi:hypothetical protein